ncbi:MAG: hypothetical protein ABSF83_05420 [Nitrososphaerales archaeon]|jgi:hypothetical protein
MMGRTVLSFRLVQMGEVVGWREFRKYLPKREREAFDETLDTARLCTSASSFAVRTSWLEGMAERREVEERR